MTGAAVATVGRVAQLVPDAEGDAWLPAWALGLMAFAILCLLLFTITRFNRDR